MAKRKFNQLRILSKRHQLLWDQELPDRFGDFNSLLLRIRIAKELPEDEEKETVLHECMHALEHQMNAYIPEECIRQLSIGLFSMLRDNPELVKYLMDGG